jgi:hypothetical protein
VKTPRAVASTASGMVPCAVSRITGKAGMAFADLVEQGQAVAPRQLHVAQHELRPFHGQLRQRVFGRLDRGDAVVRPR